MRGLLLFIITLCLTAVIPANTKAENPISVFVDGKEIFFDQQPEIIEGHMYVPLRNMFQSLGASVAWDPRAKRMTAVSRETHIAFVMGSNFIVVNNKVQKGGDLPIIQNGRVLVPLRYISELFGAEVFWDDKTKRIFIYSDPFKPVIFNNRFVRDIDNRDLVINDEEIWLGDTEKEIVELLGEPNYSYREGTKIVNNYDSYEIIYSYEENRDDIEFAVSEIRLLEFEPKPLTISIGKARMESRRHQSRYPVHRRVYDNKEAIVYEYRDYFVWLIYDSYEQINIIRITKDLDAM